MLGKKIGVSVHLFMALPSKIYSRVSLVFKILNIKPLVFFVLLFSSQLNAAADDNPLPKLYERLLPSVVTLHTFERATTDTEAGTAVKPAGLGSGVIISDDGLIVTAAHVVQTADSVHVVFIDGVRRKGKVLSSMPWVDLALIKVESLPNGVTSAKLADSAAVMVGEKAFVIGSPLGVSKTLTVGYISGRHQPDPDNEIPMAEFFQTDAAVNSGNSGGPLFNMSGDVIGIASYIKSKTGGSDGLGFAVTSESVKKFMLNKKQFWSGMKLFMLDEALSRAFQLPEEFGVLIQKVSNESPAYKAGLKGGTIPVIISNRKVLLGGDIILSVNGIKFSNDTISDITNSIMNMGANEKTKLVVWRKAKRLSFTLE